MRLTIDCGARTGWAQWSDDWRLLACGACAPNEVPLGPYSYVAIEWPRERRGGRASTASLIILAANAGIALGRVGWPNAARIDPSTWKGNVPKPAKGAPYIIATRCARALRSGEVGPPEWAWDAWDAVGIGLVLSHRLGRGCV